MDKTMYYIKFRSSACIILNCGISVSFLPVPEYLHAQLIQ